MACRQLSAALGIGVVTLGLMAPGSAHAQGRGRPKAPRAPAATTTSPAPSSTSTVSLDGPSPDVVVPAATYPQFGSWLDDASAPVAGEGHVSIGVGHWRMGGTSQTNVPMLGGGFGLTDRLQVSASVPFYHSSYSGTTMRGLDDVYVGAKYTVIDPTLTVSEFGLALSPIVEVLSADASDGRVHFALPVSVEVRRLPFRVYGSAGYFTRGAVFAGAAVEWSAKRHVTFTGALTQSYAVKEPLDAGLPTPNRTRTDLSVSVAFPVGSAAVYTSVGRSLNSVADGGTSLAVSGGISFRFNVPRAVP